MPPGAGPLSGLATCSRLVSSPAITSLTPRASVQKSSSTEMSKDSEVTASQASPGPWGMRASMPTKKFTALRCSTITPLGRPVEPEV